MSHVTKLIQYHKSSWAIHLILSLLILGNSLMLVTRMQHVPIPMVHTIAPALRVMHLSLMNILALMLMNALIAMKMSAMTMEFAPIPLEAILAIAKMALKETDLTA